ncbi:MAG: OmpA family protein [Proteobacteria bacterium]|nr:OmpA family protein [Pseudomonadota bacterium]
MKPMRSALLAGTMLSALTAAWPALVQPALASDRDGWIVLAQAQPDPRDPRNRPGNQQGRPQGAPPQQARPPAAPPQQARPPAAPPPIQQARPPAAPPPQQARPPAQPSAPRTVQPVEPRRPQAPAPTRPTQSAPPAAPRQVAPPAIGRPQTPPAGIDQRGAGRPPQAPGQAPGQFQPARPQASPPPITPPRGVPPATGQAPQRQDAPGTATQQRPGTPGAIRPQDGRPPFGGGQPVQPPVANPQGVPGQPPVGQRPGIPGQPVQPPVANPQGVPGQPPVGQRPGIPGQPVQPPVANPQGVPGQPPVGQRPGIPGQPVQPPVANPQGVPGQPPVGQRPGIPGQPVQPPVANPQGVPGQPPVGQRPGIPGQPVQPPVANPQGVPGQPGFGQRPGGPGQPPMAVPPGAPGQPPVAGPQGVPGQQPGFGQRPGGPGQPGFGGPGQGGFSGGQPPSGPPERRQGSRIGPAGAAALGVGAGLVGGFLLSRGARAERVDDIRGSRREVDQDGVRVIYEPERTIIRDGEGTFIRHDENARFRQLGGDLRSEQRGNEMYTFYDRPGGVRVITVTDGSGQLLRRIRRYPDGREVVIIDNSFRPMPRTFEEQIVVLPPPEIRIPRERYVVDADQADEGLIYETLTAPPVQRPPRRYTLDEVRYSPSVRAYTRSVDVDTINFATGSWEVTPDQAQRLATIAAALGRAIQANANEVFLIEGHTDAVGNDVDNLSLSDRRAQSVAAILTQNFNIPPENLTTQGYGEQYPKVQTQGASRENRRVTLRRVTELLNQQNTQAPQ